jgi:hypothetical protein
MDINGQGIYQGNMGVPSNFFVSDVIAPGFPMPSNGCSGVFNRGQSACYLPNQNRL